MLLMKTAPTILLNLIMYIPVELSAQHNGATDVFNTIMNNVCEVEWSAAPADILSGKEVGGLLARQSPDGSWPDINYQSHRQTSWEPGRHLLQLHNLVLSYTYRGGAFYQNPKLLTAIKNGLHFWYHADPRSTNWFNQQIFCPGQIGAILILLRSGPTDIPAALEKDLLDRMVLIGGDPDGRYSTGAANRINISTHWIYRGCLTRDLAVLQKGASNYLLPIKYNPPGRGLRRDLSYQEHGNQLYIGNYGFSFIDNISKGALFLKNTPWALTGDQLSLFSSFVRLTYLNTIRGEYYSFVIPGRQVANKNDLDRSQNVAILDRMIRIDPTHKDSYAAARKRWEGSKPPQYGVVAYHKHFWLSDYTLHVRQGYFFDVRFVSNRTVRTENVNYENKKGFFLADGATDMTIRGDEYQNIFPLWDWCKIPGTTTPLLDSLPDMHQEVGGTPGITSFCGGLSDSMDGASTYELNYPAFNIKGKKSWFFFNREIICLGNSITSESGNPVATTVNQCLSHGKVLIKESSRVKGLPSTFKHEGSVGAISWVMHDGFGYFFPGDNRVCISDTERKGSWKTISDSQKDAPVKKKVFAIWIDHGVRPDSGHYAYIVVPGIYSADDMDRYQQRSTIRILANTDTLQEVADAAEGLTEAIVFKQNILIDLDDRYALECSTPCIVTFRKNTNGWSLHLADPTQTAKKISYVVYDKQHHQVVKTATLSMPGGDMAGSTVQFDISL